MASLDQSYLKDLQNHLKHSAVFDYSVIDDTQVSFSIARSENTGWIEGKLHIKNISNVYFQRFKIGMEREGIQNIARLKVSRSENTIAWIDKIQSWTNVFTGEKGVELQFFDGIHLRFTGDIVLSITDEYLNENLTYSKPSEKHESRVKFIKGVAKAPIIHKIVADDVQTIEQMENDTLDTRSKGELKHDDHSMKLENTEEIVPELMEKKNEVNDISPLVPKEKIQTASLHEQSELSDDSSPHEGQIVDSSRSLDENSDTQQSIRRIKGVTKSNRHILIESGFDSIAKIAQAEVSELVKIKGIGKPTAKKLIDNANLLIDEIG